MENTIRAKIQGTDKWIVGFPHSVYGNGIDSIQDFKTQKIEYIKTDTICKFVANKNSINVFEHDIIEEYLSIRWDKEFSSFEFYWIYDNSATEGDILWQEFNDIFKNVIGNVFDNPEMREQ